MKDQERGKEREERDRARKDREKDGHRRDRTKKSRSVTLYNDNSQDDCVFNDCEFIFIHNAALLFFLG